MWCPVEGWVEQCNCAVHPTYIYNQAAIDATVRFTFPILMAEIETALKQSAEGDSNAS